MAIGRLRVSDKSSQVELIYQSNPLAFYWNHFDTTGVVALEFGSTISFRKDEGNEKSRRNLDSVCADAVSLCADSIEFTPDTCPGIRDGNIRLGQRVHENVWD